VLRGYRYLLLLCLWLPWGTQAQVAQRVISLAPHLTELAFAAGLGDKLVGVSKYSDFPPQAKNIEQIADWQGIKLERILALKPDLILAWQGGNPRRQLEQLAHFGIPILYIEPQSVEQIAQALDQLAGYSATPQTGQQAAAQIRQQWAQLTDRYSHNQPVAVFIQFGIQPLFTSSASTLQNEIVRQCGGQNIFADSRVPWPQVSREQVLIRHPKAIIIAGDTQQQQTVVNFWHPDLDVPVIPVDSDNFSRAGPRVMLAAEQLCKQLAQREK
jgi:vitamin B12 transport system substrate-binding protein